jgi:hypothetical protein
VSNLLTSEKDRECPEVRRDVRKTGQFAGGILLTFREFFCQGLMIGQLSYCRSTHVKVEIWADGLTAAIFRMQHGSSIRGSAEII